MRRAASDDFYQSGTIFPARERHAIPQQERMQ
jgi:hypothetical protein